MKRLLLACAFVSVVGVGLLASSGPLTNFLHLRLATDSHGAVLVSLANYGGTSGPLTNLANLRARVDSNGALLVAPVAATCPGSDGRDCVLHTWTTATSNSGTTETTLATYTLPGGTLGAEGQLVHVVAWGTIANNADQQILKGYFGAITPAVQSSIVGSSSHTTWRIDMVILRLTSATQSSSGVVSVNSAPAVVGSPSGSEDLTGDVVIKITGQSNTQSSDITLTGGFVEFLPAGGLN